MASESMMRMISESNSEYNEGETSTDDQKADKNTTLPDEVVVKDKIHLDRTAPKKMSNVHAKETEVENEPEPKKETEAVGAQSENRKEEPVQTKTESPDDDNFIKITKPDWEQRQKLEQAYKEKINFYNGIEQNPEAWVRQHLPQMFEQKKPIEEVEAEIALKYFGKDGYPDPNDILNPRSDTGKYFQELTAMRLKIAGEDEARSQMTQRQLIEDQEYERDSQARVMAALETNQKKYNKTQDEFAEIMTDIVKIKDDKAALISKIIELNAQVNWALNDKIEREKIEEKIDAAAKKTPSSPSSRKSQIREKSRSASYAEKISDGDDGVY